MYFRINKGQKKEAFLSVDPVYSPLLVSVPEAGILHCPWLDTGWALHRDTRARTPVGSEMGLVQLLWREVHAERGALCFLLCIQGPLQLYIHGVVSAERRPVLPCRTVLPFKQVASDGLSNKMHSEILSVGKAQDPNQQ